MMLFFTIRMAMKLLEIFQGKQMVEYLLGYFYFSS